MFFNSGYIIEFYKPREEVLAKIENSLAKHFLDWDKSFAGKVTSGGFKLKYVNWNASPDIKGDFRKDENGKEKLWLTISLGSLNLLAVLMISGLIFFAAFVLALFSGNYMWLFLLAFYALYIQFVRIQWISCRDEFLQLLRNSDRLCTVSPINNQN